MFFTLEASNQDVEAVQFAAAAVGKVATTAYIPEGVTVNSTVQNVSILDNAIIDYLNTSVTEKADYMTYNTARFDSSSIKQPPTSSTLPTTSLVDFRFFVNGVHVNDLSIVSFIQTGSFTILTVNTASLGYALDSGDEVIAIGKFE